MKYMTILLLLRFHFHMAELCPEMPPWYVCALNSGPLPLTVTSRETLFHEMTHLSRSMNLHAKI